VACWGPEDDLRKELEGSGINVKVLDSGYAFHITNVGVDKGTGLIKVLQMMKVAPEEVVAIGDSETDVPMFNQVGYSIAVGNSDDAARAASRHFVKGRQGAGVIEGIGYTFERLIKAGSH
jgi:hydroxymethylpyrimidine pyrophosphatase-like HAD family hydrolase